jgi:hypothetical protein
MLQIAKNGVWTARKMCKYQIQKELFKMAEYLVEESQV